MAADFDRPQPRPFEARLAATQHCTRHHHLGSGKFSRMDFAVKSHERFGGGNARPRPELRLNLVPFTTTRLFLFRGVAS
jgi:hypothetical protein